jgi:hypothetical protein
MFPRKPQPPAAPSPVVHQVLPIKTYPVAAAPKPTIGPDSKAEDLIEVIGPGRFRIRVPRNRDPRMDAWLGRDPFTLAEDMTMARLLKQSIDGTLDWPDGITTAPRMTPAERKAERIATIRRIAEGPNDYVAMLANEGFNPLDYPWDPPADEERTTSTALRRAREIRGVLRARLFGS